MNISCKNLKKKKVINCGQPESSASRSTYISRNFIGALVGNPILSIMRGQDERTWSPMHQLFIIECAHKNLRKLASLVVTNKAVKDKKVPKVLRHNKYTFHFNSLKIEYLFFYDIQYICSMLNIFYYT